MQTLGKGMTGTMLVQYIIQNFLALPAGSM
jgi:hypothetical protein